MKIVLAFFASVIVAASIALYYFADINDTEHLALTPKQKLAKIVQSYSDEELMTSERKAITDMLDASEVYYHPNAFKSTLSKSGALLISHELFAPEHKYKLAAHLARNAVFFEKRRSEPLFEAAAYQGAKFPKLSEIEFTRAHYYAYLEEIKLALRYEHLANYVMPECTASKNFEVYSIEYDQESYAYGKALSALWYALHEVERQDVAISRFQDAVTDLSGHRDFAHQFPRAIECSPI